MSFVQAANGKLYPDFMELQIPYMIDFRNGADLFKKIWKAGLTQYDNKKGLGGMTIN